MIRSNVSHRSLKAIEADIEFLTAIGDLAPDHVERLMRSFVRMQIETKVWSGWEILHHRRSLARLAISVDPAEFEPYKEIVVTVPSLPTPLHIVEDRPVSSGENLAWRAAIEALRAERGAAKLAIARPEGSARWVQESGPKQASIDVLVAPTGLNIRIYSEASKSQRHYMEYVIDSVDDLGTLIRLARGAQTKLIGKIQDEAKGDDDDDD